MDRPEFMRPERPDPLLPVVLLLVVVLAGLLARVVWVIPRPLPGLADEIAAHLTQSGVSNPVTAVLLDFRGYDTLLEVVVLFLAVATAWSLTRAPFPPPLPDTSPVQTAAVRLLTPLICLVGAYFVWQGSRLAGGAFQGGAVLAAAGVLLFVSDLPWLRGMGSVPLRIGLTLGPLVFLGTGVWCFLQGDALLDYPADSAGSFLLLIEAACGISIGLTLAALFAGGRPADDLRKERHRVDAAANDRRDP
jgi:multisubunit Na+/H+ antiporter MnhB subunit